MKDYRIIDLGTMPYDQAFALQRREVERVQRGGDDVFLLVEHPHVITAGRNADGSAITADRRLIEARGVQLTECDRGGDVTYHGPGQLVGYPILALEEDRRDIRRYVHDIEAVLIRTLGDFGVGARRHPEHRGAWVGDAKIASVGIRISRWVTSHGFALNVNTDLSFFSLMDPCGIQGCEMTSIARLRGSADMASVKHRIVHNFEAVFSRRALMAESHPDIGVSNA